MTILVVDDSESNRYQLQVLLGGNGFRVVAAANGSEALALARQDPPDLVVTDILMPVMDGFSLCREMKKDERLRKIPVLFYTATYTDERDREFALSLGADRFLVKPEEPEIILRVIRDMLRPGSSPAAPAGTPPPEEPGFLKQYNETLIRKLEEKMAQLERANRELERSLAANRDSENRFRSLVETMSELVVLHEMIVDGSGRAVDYRILDCNPAFTAITGLPRDRAVGALASELYGTAPAPFLDIYAEVARSGKPQAFEAHFAPMGKHFRIAAFSPGPGLFATVSMDITALKNVEEELRRNQVLLLQAQRLGRIGGWDYDVEKRRIRWTEEVYRIYEVPPEYNPSDVARDIEFYAPEYRPRISEAFRGAVERGEPYDLELELVTGRGRRIWVRTAGQAERRDGRIVRVFGHIMDVDDRKRAESALQEERDKLRAITRATPVALLMFAPSERIVYANPRAETLFGRERTQETNPRCGDFLGCVHRRDDPQGCGHSRHCQTCALYAAIREVLGGEAGVRGRELQAEIEVPGGSERRWFSANVEPISSREFRHAVVTLEDITEHRRLEEKLRRDEERLRHLNAVLRAIRNVNQLIVRAREPRSLIEETCRLLVETRGYLVSWIVLANDAGRPVDFAEAGLGEGAAPLREFLARGEWPPCGKRALSGGETLVIRDPRSGCPGCPLAPRYRGAAAIVSPLRHDGKSLGLLVATLPENMSADEEEESLFVEMAGDVSFALHGIEMEARRRRVEEEVELLARFPEENPNPVLRTTGEGRLLYANPASAPLLASWGRRVGEHLPEEILRRVIESYEADAHSVFDFESGGRSYSFMIAPLHKWDYVNLYGRDITDQRRAEDQFRQSQKLEAIGRLAGGVAHDFNNLLAVIIGYSDLMLPQVGNSGELRQQLQEIRAAADRAAGLTRQLLAFSRKQVLQPRVLDLNTTVNGIQKMLRRLIREDVEIVTLLDPDAGNVRADPVQVEQIILNLAVNAGDAMPKGGRLTIRTSRVALDDSYVRSHPGVPAGEYVLLSVSDTGCGMDAEAQARVFEPFFTTKEQGKGTGLGLSIVYGTVKQSGGHIDLESAPGKGTTFRVYLPRVREAPEAESPPGGEVPGKKGAETILVAEDDPVLRSMVVRILRDTGYTVLEAANGEEAKAVCARHGKAIHLLLTDVIMPVMGGTTLAGHLKRFFPGIRVMFMSGHTDAPIDRPFLQKPFSSGDLVKRVREVLDGPVESA